MLSFLDVPQFAFSGSVLLLELSSAIVEIRSAEMGRARTLACRSGTLVRRMRAPEQQ